MSKTTILTIALLIILATTGVLIFQVNWLMKSYSVSREKVRQDISNIFDETIQQHKRQRADSVRILMRKLIRSEKNIRFEFFNYKNGIDIGFRNPGHNTLFNFTVLAKDTAAIKKAPYAFLMQKINAADLDKLLPIYSTLIGTRSYPANGVDEQVANTLMNAFDLYKDTATLNRILKQRLSDEHIPFTGRITYYRDLSKVYSKPVPEQSSNKNHPAHVFSMLIGAGREPLAVQLDHLNNHIRKLNSNGNICYIAKPLLYDINDIITDNIPVLTLSLNIPTRLVLAKMYFNLIASAILLLCVGLCMAYMLRTIIKQKKLADIKADFISNITHELKTPLATALAAVQGMQYFDVLKDAGKTKNYLDTAAGEIKRLSQMINKIISLSVFENTGFKLNPSTFNFKEMLEGIITGQQLRHEKAVNIKLDYQAGEELTGDRQHLQNVMLNLIDNAINYSGSAVHIHILCTYGNGMLQIRVSDNGNGIAPEYQKMIFDKFFRAPGSGARGYGLGLNYVKQILDKHNGSIQLASSGPEGSVFIINLPH